MSNPAGRPNIQNKVLNEDGTFTKIWYRLFVQMWIRSGGEADGLTDLEEEVTVDIDDLQDEIDQLNIEVDTLEEDVSLVALAPVQGIIQDDDDLSPPVVVVQSDDLSPAIVSVPLSIEDEGAEETADASVLNFTGAGVTVTDQGGGEAEIDIPGGGGGGSTNVLHVQDQKATTVAGGSNVAGLNTRTLNTVVLNSITGASLSANQITLPAGTYDIWSNAPTFRGGRHRLQLFNTTDTTIDLLGGGEFANTGASAAGANRAKLQGQITIAAIKVFELRHYIGTVSATFGLGVDTSDGNVEVYAEVFIQER